MHERLADLFEGLMSLLLIFGAILIVVVLFGITSTLGFGSGLMAAIACAISLVLFFGSIAVLISIRHRLMSIDATLSAQKKPQ